MFLPLVVCERQGARLPLGKHQLTELERQTRLTLAYTSSILDRLGKDSWLPSLQTALGNEGIIVHVSRCPMPNTTLHRCWWLVFLLSSGIFMNTRNCLYAEDGEDIITIDISLLCLPPT